MSETPKPHVYQHWKEGGHCADCGHHLEASWHYVKGAEHHALKALVRLGVEAIRTDGHGWTRLRAKFVNEAERMGILERGQHG